MPAYAVAKWTPKVVKLEFCVRMYEPLRLTTQIINDPYVASF